MNPVRVCSWNINGLRSIQRPLKNILDSLSSDIICIQETKTTPDISSEFAFADGYNGYFTHSIHKPGYSGTAIFCRNPLKPIRTYHNLSDILFESTFREDKSSNGWNFLMKKLNISHTEARNLDVEGRVLGLQFSSDLFTTVKTASQIQPLFVLSIYFPRLNSENVERLNYKHLFQRAVQLCIESLLLENNVVIAGDFNICHKMIDHCAPDEIIVDTSCISFRQWFDQLLVEEQHDENLKTQNNVGLRRFVDIFRLLHPYRENAFTCWSSRTNARQTNYGVRLDYILFDSKLVELIKLSNSNIQADLMIHFNGSDHCPIYADLPYFYNSDLIFSYSFPPKCSHYWPQCQRKQMNLESYAVQKSLSAVTEQTFTSQDAPVSLPHVRNLNTKKRSALKQMKITLRESVPIKTAKCIYDQLSSTKETTRLVKSTSYDSSKAAQSIEAWRNLLSGPKEPPVCLSHKEPCVMRTVKQLKTIKGNRFGRRFWVCARPQGAPDNPDARCNTFFWDDQLPKNK
ncbi:DNA-(apurinic or apyrimidinic site) lyase 2 [Schistosoma japonicum]|uniref:DNA-(apurinic or apyrimidinic site) endonuclease n=1 Tax=Schistosoma japonicum TaxID=6182 RepID=A0A4Z2DJR8_SCHJA|nr:DNA-(apurinic or apyrimidinic site) lyase 2 [Schistosoma japonicum]